MKKDGIYRYSLAFKQEIVAKVESGELTAVSAERVYGVTASTVYDWLRKFGKANIIRSVIRVESPEERSRIKELERQKRELESALAKSQIKILALESLIEVAEEHYRIDIKKNSGPKGSTGPGEKDPK